MVTANLSEKQLSTANEPQFQAALDSKTEAQKQAQESPKAYRADEKGQLSKAEAEATIA